MMTNPITDSSASDGPMLKRVPPTSHDNSAVSSGSRKEQSQTPALMEYRAGIGVGYAAGVMDMRAAFSEASSDAESIVIAYDVFQRLIGRFQERCDQIAAAGGGL